MDRKVINTPNAPKAIGPYSQGIKAGNLVFVSGQIPIDPRTGEFVDADIKIQTELVLNNLKAVLEQAGASLKSVTKTTVYLKSMNDFAAMNEVYSKFFPQEPPARAAFEVSQLPKGARVEIEAIAAA